MTVKMIEILGFANFYEIVKNQKLPMKTAYKLAQLARAIEQEVQFYQEKMRTFITEYGLLGEDGQPIPTEDNTGIKLRPGAEEECYAAINELQNLDTNLPDVSFTIEEFSNVEITLTEMQSIFPFLKD